MKYSSRIWATCRSRHRELLLIAAVPAAVQAQSPNIRVYIPFEFHVGNATLPPGNYTVQQKEQAGPFQSRTGWGIP